MLGLAEFEKELRENWRREAGLESAAPRGIDAEAIALRTVDRRAFALIDFDRDPRGLQTLGQSEASGSRADD